MTVKGAKLELQKLINKLNECDENTTFDINVYDNYGCYYTSDFGNWDVDINKERVHLNIE